MATELILIEALILVALFVCGAFFSVSETAMIGVSRFKVRHLADQGNPRAKLVDQMLDDPERILSTVLVGNTIVNITSAAVATVIAEQLFSSWATTIAAIVTTVIVLIACELLPKTLAVAHPLPIALRIARPLRTVESVLKPIIYASERTTALILRVGGVKVQGKAPYITSDEIEMLVRMGVETGEVQKFEQRVIAELFDFTETDVRKVMTPMGKVHALQDSAMLRDAVELAVRHGRTRLPVMQGDVDHILGFIHIKDLLRFTDEQLAQLSVRSVLRGCMTVPADMSADRLLVQMQREHRLLAVVQDGGHNVGIVTAEDLLEELVGEIHDEFDAARPKSPTAPTEGGTATP